MAYIIAEPCVGVCDTACVQVCPVNCIYGPEGYDVTNEEHLKEMREKKDAALFCYLTNDKWVFV